MVSERTPGGKRLRTFCDSFPVSGRLSCCGSVKLHYPYFFTGGVVRHVSLDSEPPQNEFILIDPVDLTLADLIN